MSNPDNEHFLKSSWRPAMAWSYFAVCLWDFLIAPIFMTWFNQRYGIPHTPWKPMTLGEGGMYHIAMGAILGVAAWTRGQEKVARLESTRSTEIRYVNEPNRPPLSFDE